MESAIADIMESLFGVSARKIPNSAGLLISLAPSFGHITQLWQSINDKCSWDTPINVSKCYGLIKELIYWQHNLSRLNGSCKIDNDCHIYPIKVFSDSSSIACAAFVENEHEMVCHRMFSDSEKLQSSTARELMAIDLAINSFCKVFENKEVQICFDNA